VIFISGKFILVSSTLLKAVRLNTNVNGVFEYNIFEIRPNDTINEVAAFGKAFCSTALFSYAFQKLNP